MRTAQIGPDLRLSYKQSKNFTESWTTNKAWKITKSHWTTFVNKFKESKSLRWTYFCDFFKIIILLHNCSLEQESFFAWACALRFDKEHASLAKNVYAIALQKNGTWSILGNVIGSEAKMPAKCCWDERSDDSFFWQWQRPAISSHCKRSKIILVAEICYFF